MAGARGWPDGRRARPEAPHSARGAGPPPAPTIRDPPPRAGRRRTRNHTVRRKGPSTRTRKEGLQAIRRESGGQYNGLQPKMSTTSQLLMKKKLGRWCRQTTAGPAPDAVPARPTAEGRKNELT